MFEVYDTQIHHGYILHHGTVLRKDGSEAEHCGIVMGDGAETSLDWVYLKALKCCDFMLIFIFMSCQGFNLF